MHDKEYLPPKFGTVESCKNWKAHCFNGVQQRAKSHTLLQAIVLKEVITDTEVWPLANTHAGAGSNHLFPVFLNLEALSILIVGGGAASLEKLRAIIANAPATTIKLVAEQFDDALVHFADPFPNIQFFRKSFDADDVSGVAIVVVAVKDSTVSSYIHTVAKMQGKLVYVDNRPELSDFHIGAIVQKGALKIAISTNGKSPAVARRLKEVFNELLPMELDEVLTNMSRIRAKLSGDFSKKVKKLNHYTRSLSLKDVNSNAELYWRRVATYCLFAFFFMFLGHFILSYIPFNEVWTGVQSIGSSIDNTFYWMIAAGFLAQLVDGALGMGYGVTCTTVLLSMGVNLPAISSSIHTAEMFSSGISGYTHYRFGNVNKKLFRTLLIPGIIGAVGGAILLSKFGESNASFIKPLLASYTLILGLRILLTALRKKRKAKKVKRVGWLAGAGGFLDSFGGGGWGPLVTSSLISKGRTPKYVIGSVSITEFFVTLASSITFFIFLGVSHWQIIAGLIIGGMLAAPLAAKLVGKLPVKTMLVAVGLMVMLWSVYILVRALM